MTSINTTVILYKKVPKDLFITVSLALYILTFYFINTPVTNVLSSSLLYVFIGLTIFKLLTKQTPIKIISYSLWYTAFMLLGALSFYYALNGDYVLTDLYILFVSVLLTFSFIQYAQNLSSIKRIFSFFTYLPIFPILYLFISGELNASSERLGQSTFGNANNLAMVMMISLFCTCWFIVYGNKKHIFVNIALAILYLYVTALTGGRKFFLMPFIFLMLLLIFKFWRDKKLSSVLLILIFLVIVLSSAWAVINIPVLFNSIGVRFEGLLNFINGDLAASDPSTLNRYILIVNGWKWFLEKPLLGYGLNNYSGLYSDLWGSSYAHNNYIELMVDLGLVGVLVYYSFYIYTIVSLVKIPSDTSGFRDFFLALIIVLGIFEIGAVTYNLFEVQLLIGLASVYTWLVKRIKGKELSYG